MIFLELFLTFFKIGLFTFGGGYAMLPFIQEAVVTNNWMPEEEIVNFIAVSESTPGPFAVNISTYVGAEMGGILGSVCATLGVVLPSFIVILIVSKIYDAFKSNKYVAGCMQGLRPCVVGLIAAAVLDVFFTVFVPVGWDFSKKANYTICVSAVIFITTYILQKKKLHPIYLILISAALGIGAGYLGKLLGIM